MKMLSLATLALSALTASAPAAAQGTAGYYVAVPVTAPTLPTLVTRTAAWHLQGAAFVAAQAPERPQLLCQLVADRAGPLASFSAGGKAFDADALVKCNAKATARTGSVAVAAK